MDQDLPREKKRRYQIISADGHTIEPPTMWECYLPSRYHDRMPKLVKDPEGGDAWEVVPGQPVMPIGLVTNRGEWGRRYEDNSWFGTSYDNMRQGAFDGAARLEEQAIDGVDAEVLYPSQRTMAAFMSQPDPGYHLAGLDAYNQWMWEEFSAADRNRLIGLYQMPGVDIESSLMRLKEAKSLGAKGVIISALPSGNKELSEEDDPFWAAAEEAELPIHIHAGLKHAGLAASGEIPKVRSADHAIEFAVPSMELMGGAVAEFSGAFAKMIYSGLFDRYPNVQFVMAECGAGWIPHCIEHMDDHWWRNRVWSKSSLKELPSYYFHRNWKATFIREPFAIQNRAWFGVDNLLWSNDYPHHRHDWPYSRRIIEESMAGVDPIDKFKMICGNAQALYGLEA
ncbi:MAG: amidohydrolase family protein [Myxococcota bacterium]